MSDAIQYKMDDQPVMCGTRLCIVPVVMLMIDAANDELSGSPAQLIRVNN